MKQKKINILTDDVINQVVDCIKTRKKSNICQVVTIEDIREKKYNLSPVIYKEIDFSREQSHRAYSDIVKDLNRVILEKNACKLTINESLAKKIGFDLSLYKKADFEELNTLLKKIADEKIIKEDYFQTSKNKNEIKFENKSKDSVSSILMMIFQMWKQHIYYLNNEENSYLAELRDALLPELLNGNLEI